MTTIKQGTSLIAAATLLSLSAFLVLNDRPAFAETSKEKAAAEFAFQFSYESEELQSRDGAEALLNRLQREVRSACRTDQRLSLAEQRVTEACVDATMAKTVRELRSTTVASVYENRTDG